MCFVRSRQRTTAKSPVLGGRKAIDESLQIAAKDVQEAVKNQQRGRGYNEGATDDPLAFEPRPMQANSASAIVSSQYTPAPTKPRTSDSVRTTCAAVKRYIEVDKKGKNHPVIVVQHNYHDHSHEKEADHQQQKHKPRGGVAIPFPLKLHDMLEKAMAEGHGDVVSWQPHGRCFVVHKPQEFQEVVLPMYFKLTKLSSFQRQLNLYGFQRLTLGRDRGGYYHELFLRKKAFLARGMQRVQVKGTGVRARSNPDQEPNFWTMQWCDSRVPATTVSSDDESQGSINRGRTSTRKYSIPVVSPTSSCRSSSSRTAFTSSILESSIQPIMYPSMMMSRWGAHNHAVTKNPVPELHLSYRRSTPARRIAPDTVDDDDLVFSFGDKPFHYLDPFQPLSLNQNNCGNNSEVVSNDVYAETFAHLLS